MWDMVELGMNGCFALRQSNFGSSRLRVGREAEESG